MTLTDKICDVLRTEDRPFTVREIHKQLPEGTQLDTVAALCSQARKKLLFLRESVGAVSGYRLNPNKPAPASGVPAKSTPRPAPKPVPGPRKVQVRPYVPAQPEIVVLGDARGVSIQMVLHGRDGERVATQVIDLEPDDLPALIRGLATFVETPA